MSFTANVSGGTSGDITYDWSVTNGTISSGQGTPSITVDTTGLANNTNITATVTIGGALLCAECVKQASETGSVSRPDIPARLIDEFGVLPNDEVRARIDNLFVALGNEPNAQGYIINYGTDREIDRREQLIRNHISLRRYDASRITFVRGGANPTGNPGVYTKLWIVPPGATPPQP
jgi:hypothetical protein